MNKETIKEFLKPNKQKLLVFLILFLILFLAAPSSVSCPGPSTKFDKIGGTCIFVNDLGWKFFEFSDHSYFNTLFYNIMNFSLIFTLIISYFLSCLIVFSYNKFRTKK